MGSGLFALGTRAMFANQTMLETTSHNISNANTPGYSRQDVKLETENGRFTGAGFFGRGVRVSTIERTSDPFLAREVNQTAAVAASDAVRFQKLQQLEKIFPLGEAGLGHAAGELLNAFVDVANQPRDLSARQVVLSRAEDLAARARAAGQQLDALQEGIVADVKVSVAQINSIARELASINDKVAAVKGIGHEPNDLLDRRDRLIAELSELIQVSTIKADDGTMGVFIGGGQRLVLGKNATEILVQPGEFDASQVRLMIRESSDLRVVDGSEIQGGSIAGLLKVQNNDIPNARNLVGQMVSAVAWRINQQQALGLDLTQTSPTLPLDFDALTSIRNVFSMAPPSVLASRNNTSSISSPPVSLQVTNGTELQASDYSLSQDSNGVLSLTRLSDGVRFTVTDGDEVDGFRINLTGPVNNGDQFLLRPVSPATSSLSRTLSDPTRIAAASAFTATFGVNNTGTAAQSALTTVSTPDAAQPPLNGESLSIVFTSANGDYELQTPSGPVGSGTWEPGMPISYNGFELRLAGVPRDGDTIEVSRTVDVGANNGNALSLVALRDALLVGRLRDSAGNVISNGRSVTDAFADAVGSIGVMVQSAETSASISEALAGNARDVLANKTGVNMDEEAARLIQFQQNYQAAAKILQIAQTVFETLLSTAGR